MGLMELIGIMLLMFGIGVWFTAAKDWMLERFTVMYAFIKEAVKNREWWDAQYRKNLNDAYQKITELKATVLYQDKVRAGINEKIEKDLMPRLRDHEIVLKTTQSLLTTTTSECDVLKLQLRDAYAKLELALRRPNELGAEICKLHVTVKNQEQEIESLMERNKILRKRKSNQAFLPKPIVVKRYSTFRELIGNRKVKRSATKKFDVLGNIIARYNKPKKRRIS